MGNILDTRVVAVGKQDFSSLIDRNNFYIDKTHFIKEWWESDDPVTLITRPQRFGKTLLMSMVEQFFSTEYKMKGYLFEGLHIFKEKKYRELQGTYPVIFLSFANVKGNTFEKLYKKIQSYFAELFRKKEYLLESDLLRKAEKKKFQKIMDEEADWEDYEESLHLLCDYLFRFHEQKPIILLDEYDTPMQEAYLSGYWDNMVPFIRNMFNSAFKTNPCLERAILTGITRISRESIFSDLNNLKVITTTTEKYEDCFGFTEEEVFTALNQRDLSDQKDEVKRWYDGFTFGSLRNVYNPWSIINFLDEKKFLPYWANTSSNGLISHLLQSADEEIKEKLEILMEGGTITETLDDQIVFNQLEEDVNAIWSLMLASGYLKVESANVSIREYTLSLTNFEVQNMLKEMIKRWFQKSSHYNKFVRALLAYDRKAMNEYLNRVLVQTISFFDGGNKVSGTEPERFYHGLVLGLIVELEGKYSVRSNRESGFGRYDVMIEPKGRENAAYILEFKVFDPEDEKTLDDTAQAGLKQIDEKGYAAELINRGFLSERIRRYAFAFKGKRVLIKEG